MYYVALLRGINVGGHTKVDMESLRNMFLDLGFTEVSTYINSGNVVFKNTHNSPIEKITRDIKGKLRQRYNVFIPVLVISEQRLKMICEKIPSHWINDPKTMKCDVLFLWKDIDTNNILNQLTYKPDIEDVFYTPGAVIWRIDRQNINKSNMAKIVGTTIYKKITVRNVNTVRKLVEKIR